MDSTPISNGTVVVGIDGSAPANRALAWAARQAAVEHRALTLVHARDPLYPIWVGPPALDPDDLRASATRQARATMTDAVAWVSAHQPGVLVHEHLCETDPRQELLERGTTAAMVVVGSRGRGPVRTLLLGSVSAAVSAHATCPVVVVRPRAGQPEEEDGDDARRGGVLVGVQGAAASRPVLEHAFHLASSRGLPLTVLQCFSDADGAARDSGLLERAVAAVRVSFRDVEVGTTQRQGFLDQALVELAPTVDAVVVGSRHPNLLRRSIYGSLARTVLEHAEGVVVVVPVIDDDQALAPVTGR